MQGVAGFFEQQRGGDAERIGPPAVSEEKSDSDADDACDEIAAENVFWRGEFRIVRQKGDDACRAERREQEMRFHGSGNT